MADSTSGPLDREARGTSVPASPVLQPVEFDPFIDAPRLRSLSLTPTQREVLAAVQMGPQAQCAFNLCYALHLAGPLSAVSMRQAMQHVVDRHAALRMCIAEDGQSQSIEDQLAVDLPHVDLSGLEPAAQRQALAELLSQEAATPFDLHTAPLWRAQVLSWTADRHVLVLVVHHLAADGWSSSVLFGDLASAYASDRFGTAVQWPEALPYEDYLAQQAQPERQARQQAAREYWIGQHTPPAEPVRLPTDHVRPPLKTYACLTSTQTIEPALSAAVRQLGARHGCTSFATLLAVFAAQAARLSGSSDIVIGVPMASQTLLDNSHVIAHGAHMVPLRLAVDVEQTFSAQLAGVQRALLDAQAHQELTFGNLVHDLALPRDPSRTPLVDVVFNVDRLGAPLDFGELRVERVEAAKSFMPAELWLDVVDDGQQLVLQGSCNAALYEAATLHRWLQAYRHALQRLVGDPALSLADAFAPAGAEAALLETFNATRSDYDDRLRLEALVQRQVARTPHAVALWCGERGMTYAELDARANGVAYALQAEGVGPGDRVGLYCGRDETMVAGVLGILKAGAAYVPLDTALPAARLRFMAQDAGLRLVACDAQSAASWPLDAVRHLQLESCTPRAQTPAVPARATDIAYVIYTSGSTGQPKGVPVAHRAVINVLQSLVREPGLRPDDRMAAVATLSFDISVFDLFGPLGVGASVILVPRLEAQDGAALERRLRDSGATVMQATPSTWRLLLDGGWRGREGFRAFSGGEPLTPELARALQQRCAEVWNLYGPTETTIWSAGGRVDDVGRGIRIGRPLANTRIHVLDARQRLLPLGAVGEICIGGDGVASGYLGRPQLTAERFVPDPEDPGRTMYRTGDLGRWHADGSLECLGRSDHQVKLRGYRIELGEIESCLLTQPGVRRALATVHAAHPGDERLLAYVVADEDAFDPRALRDALSRELPAYMVPALIMRIDDLPLLPSGKVDRRALPAPPEAVPEPGAASAPLTEREEAVAAIWRRMLGVPQVLATDNFFDLGGYSMLAVRTAQEMQRVLGHPVGVPRLVMETLSQLVQPVQSDPAADAAATSPGARDGSWLRRWAGRLRRG